MKSVPALAAIVLSACLAQPLIAAPGWDQARVAYVIDGDGTVTPNNAGAKDTYVITSGGVQSLERKSANTSNTFTFSGSGWGHNVGMSQWGAFAMAEQGYTYRDILNFYYTGITLS